MYEYHRRQGRLKEEAARIYAAEIALALQHLHDSNVIYRDLKPENVLIGADGHIKLTDFGLCRYFEIPSSLYSITAALKQQSSNNSSAAAGSTGTQSSQHAQHAPLRPPSPHITHSFCGTEEYMAVEMLLNQGHGCAVDWWCLGLCLHEMMTRKHPFKGTLVELDLFCS